MTTIYITNFLLSTIILTFYCLPIKLREVTAKEALPGYNSFWHEFLEIVDIRVKNESEELVGKVVKILGALVKTIGKIVIL